MGAEKILHISLIDQVLADAADSIKTRWDLSDRAAHAALHEIADEVGVDVDDLAALIVASNALPDQAPRVLPT